MKRGLGKRTARCRLDEGKVRWSTKMRWSRPISHRVVWNHSSSGGIGLTSVGFRSWDWRETEQVMSVPGLAGQGHVREVDSKQPRQHRHWQASGGWCAGRLLVLRHVCVLAGCHWAAMQQGLTHCPRLHQRRHLGRHCKHWLRCWSRLHQGMPRGQDDGVAVRATMWRSGPQVAR